MADRLEEIGSRRRIIDHTVHFGGVERVIENGKRHFP